MAPRHRYPGCKSTKHNKPKTSQVHQFHVCYLLSPCNYLQKDVAPTFSFWLSMTWFPPSTFDADKFLYDGATDYAMTQWLKHGRCHPSGVRQSV